MRLVLGCNTNAAVAHRKLQQHILRGLLYHPQAQHHLAPAGEFDGIAAQVDQHLLQAHIVTHQRAGHVGSHIKQYLNRLVTDVRRQDDGQVAQQAVQPERARVQRHLAGFDLGEIQNVIEQPQE